MIFDQKLSKQRSNSLIKEHDVTTVKKSSNGQNLSILWRETTSSDGLLDYNLISVLESHRLMGIGNSNWIWIWSWPKLLTFKCERALKNHQYYGKIEENQVANFVPYISSGINFGHLMTWPINIIILGDFDHLQERHTRSIFIIFLAQSNWWYTIVYKRGKNLPWNDIL